MKALFLTLSLASRLGAFAPDLAAQDFLDRGTFIIARGGSEVGREEFAIRTTVGRQGHSGVLAVSTVRYPGRELQHALELTAEHAPLSFQQTETAGGRVVRHLAAQLAGIRYSARLTSADGESAREFPVQAPVVVLGDDAFNEYYFVPRPADGGPRTVSVVRPGDARAVRAGVQAGGTDTVTVAGRALEARRYTLRLEDGEERHFWLTAAGDLLRVALPATGTVATRAEPPRR